MLHHIHPERMLHTDKSHIKSTGWRIFMKKKNEWAQKGLQIVRAPPIYELFMLH